MSLTLFCSGVGCGFADKGAVTSLPGAYSSEATWDLGGPFTQNQTMSENLADLFIANVIGSLGAPGSVEKELEEAISGVIRTDLASMIEAQIPEEINSNSTLLSVLSTNLASVQVESEVHLVHEQDDLLGLDRIVGRETIKHLVLDTPAGAVDVPIASLAEDESQPVIESTYSTTVFQDRMDIANQAVSIRYGTLISWAFEESSGVNPSVLTEELAEVLDCSAFVDQLTGSVGVPEVTVAGQIYTMDLQIFSDSCSDLDASLSQNSLGIFEPHADLLISGPTAMMYSEEGGQVSNIQSAEGYGGNIDGAPSVFSSMLDLSFTATRISDSY
jgi:hypothetical protein